MRTVILHQAVSGIVCALGAMLVSPSASGQVLYESAKLIASDAAAVDVFGVSVSISGNRALVGAYLDDCPAGPDCGSAYVYRYNGSAWVQEQKLTASDAAAGDFFGLSVSLSGDRAIVGAYWDYCPLGIACGSAYIYRYNGTAWVQEQKLTAFDAEWGDMFGVSVSLSSDRAIVGAFLDKCAAGDDCGSAYVYRYNGTAWALEQKLTASDPAFADIFGASVSLSGDAALVGAPSDYRYNGTTWVEEQKLTASDAAAGDLFGHSVSILFGTVFAL